MSNDIRDRLQETARAIEAHLPPNTGFILLAFDFSGGRLEYISNGRREDCLTLMQEFLARNGRKEVWNRHSDEPPDLTIQE